ncbi:DUF3299 domain-containing protein [Vibrio comitans]|uniref:DUF3299 domain-containing protein n=1 Tax=Vibrio comitans NBRC 102076 TaxID=1219078 RepID=A0A4Y3IKR4_9VIBR|nr:DUF3299 domain-containing protein [Vibrio comitans]GEA59340.1 hypothetical protein VCO01S_05330 [Vibrio comitans NBRC 102076]
MHRHLVLPILAILLSNPAFATREVDWSMLAPKITMPDSIVQLSILHKSLFQQLITISQINSPTEEQRQQASRAQKTLEDSGINVEEIIKIRQEKLKKASTMIDSTLLGEKVKIAGYLIPLDLNGGRSTEFLLVPTAGACIHTPPPPMNQIVLVQFDQGFKITDLYTPVWVHGQLSTQRSKQNVVLSDGSANVEAAYHIDATQVAFYQ